MSDETNTTPEVVEEAVAEVSPEVVAEDAAPAEEVTEEVVVEDAEATA